MLGLKIILTCITVVYAYMPYQCGNIPIPYVEKGIEKCFNTLETGGQQNDMERTSMLDAVNMFRGMIANQCDKFESGPPKSVSNYPKVTYNCQLEADSYFDCPKELEDFESCSLFYRGVDIVTDSTLNRSVMWRMVPNVTQTYIDPDTQIVNKFESVRKRPLRKLMSFMMNPSATEIGCFVRTCKYENKNYDLIACKTGLYIGGTEALYSAGSRCQKNEDCTLPGLSICDKEYGLCENSSTKLPPINVLIKDESTVAVKSTTNFQATVKVGTTFSTTTDNVNDVIPLASKECEYNSDESEENENPEQPDTASGINTPQTSANSNKKPSPISNRITTNTFGSNVYVRRYPKIRKPLIAAMKQIKKVYRNHAIRTLNGFKPFTNNNMPSEPVPTRRHKHVRCYYRIRQTLFAAQKHLKDVYKVRVQRVFSRWHPITYNGAPIEPKPIGRNSNVRSFWRIRQTLFRTVKHARRAYQTPVQRTFNGIHPITYNGVPLRPNPIGHDGYVRRYFGFKRILSAAVNHINKVYRIPVRRVFKGWHLITDNSAAFEPNLIRRNGYVRPFWRIRQTLFRAVEHARRVYRTPVQRTFNGFKPITYNSASFKPNPIRRNGYVPRYFGLRRILSAAVNHVRGVYRTPGQRVFNGWHPIRYNGVPLEPTHIGRNGYVPRYFGFRRTLTAAVNHVRGVYRVPVQRTFNGWHPITYNGASFEPNPIRRNGHVRRYFGFRRILFAAGKHVRDVYRTPVQRVFNGFNPITYNRVPLEPKHIGRNGYVPRYFGFRRILSAAVNRVRGVYRTPIQRVFNGWHPIPYNGLPSEPNPIRRNGYVPRYFGFRKLLSAAVNHVRGVYKTPVQRTFNGWHPITYNGALFEPNPIRRNGYVPRYFGFRRILTAAVNHVRGVYRTPVQRVFNGFNPITYNRVPLEPKHIGRNGYVPRYFGFRKLLSAAVNHVRGVYRTPVQRVFNGWHPIPYNGASFEPNLIRHNRYVPRYFGLRRILSAAVNRIRGVYRTPIQRVFNGWRPIPYNGLPSEPNPIRRNGYVPRYFGFRKLLSAAVNHVRGVYRIPVQRVFNGWHPIPYNGASFEPNLIRHNRYVPRYFGFRKLLSAAVNHVRGVYRTPVQRVFNGWHPIPYNGASFEPNLIRHNRYVPRYFGFRRILFAAVKHVRGVYRIPVQHIFNGFNPMTYNGVSFEPKPFGHNGHVRRYFGFRRILFAAVNHINKVYRIPVRRVFKGWHLITYNSAAFKPNPIRRNGYVPRYFGFRRILSAAVNRVRGVYRTPIQRVFNGWHPIPYNGLPSEPNPIRRNGYVPRYFGFRKLLSAAVNHVRGVYKTPVQRTFNGWHPITYNGALFEPNPIRRNGYVPRYFGFRRILTAAVNHVRGVYRTPVQRVFNGFNPITYNRVPLEPKHIGRNGYVPRYFGFRKLLSAAVNHVRGVYRTPVQRVFNGWHPIPYNGASFEPNLIRHNRYVPRYFGLRRILSAAVNRVRGVYRTPIQRVFNGWRPIPYNGLPSEPNPIRRNGYVPRYFGFRKLLSAAVNHVRGVYRTPVQRVFNGWHPIPYNGASFEPNLIRHNRYVPRYFGFRKLLLAAVNHVRGVYKTPVQRTFNGWHPITYNGVPLEPKHIGRNGYVPRYFGFRRILTAAVNHVRGVYRIPVQRIFNGFNPMTYNGVSFEPKPFGHNGHVRRYFGFRRILFAAVKHVREVYRIPVQRVFNGFNPMTYNGVSFESKPFGHNGHVRRYFGFRRILFAAVKHVREVYRIPVQRVFNGFNPMTYNGVSFEPKPFGHNGHVRRYFGFRRILFAAVKHVREVYRIPVQRVFNGFNPMTYNGVSLQPKPFGHNGYVRRYFGFKRILFAAVKHVRNVYRIPIQQVLNNLHPITYNCDHLQANDIGHNLYVRRYFSFKRILCAAVKQIFGVSKVYVHRIFNVKMNTTVHGIQSIPMANFVYSSTTYALPSAANTGLFLEPESLTDVHITTAAIDTTILPTENSISASVSTPSPPTEQPKTTFDVYGYPTTDAASLSTVPSDSTVKPHEINGAGTVSNSASTDVYGSTVSVGVKNLAAENDTNAGVSTSENAATLSPPMEQTKTTFDVYGYPTTDAASLSTVPSDLTVKPHKIIGASTVSNSASTDVYGSTVAIGIMNLAAENNTNTAVSTSGSAVTLSPPAEQAKTTFDAALLSTVQGGSTVKRDKIELDVTVSNSASTDVYGSTVSVGITNLPTENNTSAGVSTSGNAATLSPPTEQPKTTFDVYGYSTTDAALLSTVQSGSTVKPDKIDVVSTVTDFYGSTAAVGVTNLAAENNTRAGVPTSESGATLSPPTEQPKTTFDVYGYSTTDAALLSTVPSGSTVKPDKIDDVSTVTDFYGSTAAVGVTNLPTENNTSAGVSTSGNAATLSPPTEQPKTTFDVYGYSTTDAALLSTVQSGSTVKPDKIDVVSTVTDFYGSTAAVGVTNLPTENNTSAGVPTSESGATLSPPTEQPKTTFDVYGYSTTDAALLSTVQSGSTVKPDKIDGVSTVTDFYGSTVSIGITNLAAENNTRAGVPTSESGATLSPPTEQPKTTFDVYGYSTTDAALLSTVPSGSTVKPDKIDDVSTVTDFYGSTAAVGVTNLPTENNTSAGVPTSESGATLSPPTEQPKTTFDVYGYSTTDAALLSTVQSGSTVKPDKIDDVSTVTDFYGSTAAVGVTNLPTENNTSAGVPTSESGATLSPPTEQPKTTFDVYGYSTTDAALLSTVQSGSTVKPDKIDDVSTVTDFYGSTAAVGVTNLPTENNTSAGVPTSESGATLSPPTEQPKTTFDVYGYSTTDAALLSTVQSGSTVKPDKIDDVSTVTDIHGSTVSVGITNLAAENNTSAGVPTSESGATLSPPTEQPKTTFDVYGYPTTDAASLSTVPSDLTVKPHEINGASTVSYSASTDVYGSTVSIGITNLSTENNTSDGVSTSGSAVTLSPPTEQAKTSFDVYGYPTTDAASLSTVQSGSTVKPDKVDSVSTVTNFYGSTVSIGITNLPTENNTSAGVPTSESGATLSPPTEQPKTTFDVYGYSTTDAALLSTVQSGSTVKPDKIDDISTVTDIHGSTVSVGITNLAAENNTSAGVPTSESGATLSPPTEQPKTTFDVYGYSTTDAALLSTVQSGSTVKPDKIDDVSTVTDFYGSTAAVGVTNLPTENNTSAGVPTSESGATLSPPTEQPKTTFDVYGYSTTDAALLSTVQSGSTVKPDKIDDVSTVTDFYGSTAAVGVTNLPTENNTSAGVPTSESGATLSPPTEQPKTTFDVYGYSTTDAALLSTVQSGSTVKPDKIDDVSTVTDIHGSTVSVGITNLAAENNTSAGVPTSESGATLSPPTEQPKTTFDVYGYSTTDAALLSTVQSGSTVKPDKIDDVSTVTDIHGSTVSVGITNLAAENNTSAGVPTSESGATLSPPTEQPKTTFDVYGYPTTDAASLSTVPSDLTVKPHEINGASTVSYSASTDVYGSTVSIGITNLSTENNTSDGVSTSGSAVTLSPPTEQAKTSFDVYGYPTTDAASLSTVQSGSTVKPDKVDSVSTVTNFYGSTVSIGITNLAAENNTSAGVSTSGNAATLSPPTEQPKSTFDVYGYSTTDAALLSNIQSGSTVKPDNIDGDVTVSNNASTDVHVSTAAFDTTVLPTENKTNAAVSTSNVEATLSTPTKQAKTTFDVYGQRFTNTDSLSTVQSGSTAISDKADSYSTAGNSASTDVYQSAASIGTTVLPTEHRTNDDLSTSKVEVPLSTTTEDDVSIAISKNDSLIEPEVIQRNMTVGNNTILLDVKEEPPLLNKIYNGAEGLVMEFTHTIRVLLSPVLGNTTVH